jgi:hypothetical protein
MLVLASPARAATRGPPARLSFPACTAAVLCLGAAVLHSDLSNARCMEDERVSAARTLLEPRRATSGRATSLRVLPFSIIIGKCP